MKWWPTAKEADSFLRHGTGRGIKIAIIDSGVEAAHPRLNGLQLADDLAIVDDGFNIAARPGEGRDVFGHGTAVANVVRMVAPEAQIGSFRVLGGQLRSHTQIIRVGARLALHLGYHILNCSFGCSREDHVLFYKDWVDEAYVRGRHIVAACNNDEFTKREWPGCFPTVLTTAFTDCADADTLFRKSGRLVEFLARGQEIELAWLDGGCKKVTGSSFAAPHVAGLLARLLSRWPDLSPLEAKAILLRWATPFNEPPQDAPKI